MEGFIQTVWRSGVLILLRILGAGSAFVLVVLFGRLAGPERLGEYAAHMAIAVMGAGAVSFGLPIMITRAMSISPGPFGREQLRSAAYRILKLIGLNGAIVGSVMVVLMFAGGGAERLVAPTMVLSLLIALNQVRGGWLRGIGRPILADFLDSFVRPVLAIFLGLLVVIRLRIIDPDVVLWVQVLSQAVVFVVSIPAALHEAGGTRVSTFLEFGIRDLLPFAIIGLLPAVESQIAVSLISVVSGNRAAGEFQAAFQVAAVVVLGLGAINAGLQQKIANAYAHNRREDLREVMRNGAIVSSVFGLVVCAPAILMPEYVLSWFGGGFAAAAWPLRILCVAQLINSICGSCGTLLTMCGEERTVRNGVALGILTNVLIILLIGPRLGSMAAALGAAGSVVIWNAVFITRCIRDMKINPTIFGFAR